MSSIETWMQQHPHDIVAGRTLWAGGAVVFFFAPAFLFVLGRRHLSMPGSFWWRVPSSARSTDPRILEVSLERLSQPLSEIALLVSRKCGGNSDLLGCATRVVLCQGATSNNLALKPTQSGAVV